MVRMALLYGGTNLETGEREGSRIASGISLRIDFSDLFRYRAKEDVHATWL